MIVDFESDFMGSHSLITDFHHDTIRDVQRHETIGEIERAYFLGSRARRQDDIHILVGAAAVAAFFEARQTRNGKPSAFPLHLCIAFLTPRPVLGFKRTLSE